MTTATRILWLLRALDAAPDAVLERALRDVPPSTVRGARKRLERAGIVEQAGRCKDRKRWRLATPARRWEAVVQRDLW